MSYAVRSALLYGPGFMLSRWRVMFVFALFLGGFNTEIVVSDVMQWNMTSVLGLVFNLPAAIWWLRGALVAWKRRELRR